MKGKHLSQPQLALYQSSFPTPFSPTMLARTSSRLPLLLHLDTNASLMNERLRLMAVLKVNSSSFSFTFSNFSCLFLRNSNFHAKILFFLPHNQHLFIVLLRTRIFQVVFVHTVKRRCLCLGVVYSSHLARRQILR